MVKKHCTSAEAQSESNVNEGIEGGVYWVEKGHMVPEAMGGQTRDSICHGVLFVSHCTAEQEPWGIQGF